MLSSESHSGQNHAGNTGHLAEILLTALIYDVMRA
jgi:hypothetical protein